MITEMTNTTDANAGVLFYDGACGVCRSGAQRTHRMLRRRGFRLLPLQSLDAARLTRATPEALMREMHLVTPTGQVLRGVDAILYVAPLLRWVAMVPGVKRVMRVGYAWVAANRYPLSASCALGREDHGGRWTPPLVWLALALLMRSHLAPWAWLSSIALALYTGGKWAIWWPHRFAPPRRTRTN